MKRLILLLIISFVSLHAWGEEIVGEWNGVLKIPVQLRIVFHIQKTESGYSATMDSPDQNAKDIPVSSVSYENEVLKLAVAIAGIEYEGRLGDDGNITGTFKQMGQSFPLNLSRQAIKFVRPQEPAKPYPYCEENVAFENKEDGVTLSGTLTFPEQDGVFPAVVLISGSGRQNRDGEYSEHKPFLVIADCLSRNGIAVLRFDDRGTAASTGNSGTATTYDFSKDAEAAVKYLQTRKEINQQQIGLIGHSEGGCIAPMIAARNDDIAFIVMLAGAGIRGDQIILMQQDAIGKVLGVSDEDRKLSGNFYEKLFNLVLQSTEPEQLKDSLTGYLKQAVKDNPKMGQLEKTGKVIMTEMTSPWMQYFLKYDPAPILEKVKCPVLAINGEKDLQVLAEVNLNAIETALTKGENKQFTLKKIPGLNHMFQECDTGATTEYSTIEQTFSPVVLDEILTWIKSGENRMNRFNGKRK
jgi:pimeloyl-ACP methyl ester carboxylesterase